MDFDRMFNTAQLSRSIPLILRWNWSILDSSSLDIHSLLLSSIIKAPKHRLGRHRKILISSPPKAVFEKPSSSSDSRASALQSACRHFVLIGCRDSRRFRSISWLVLEQFFIVIYSEKRDRQKDRQKIFFHQTTPHQKLVYCLPAAKKEYFLKECIKSKTYRRSWSHRLLWLIPFAVYK